MENREQEILKTSNEMVRMVSKMPGGSDPLARYDSRNPDSLGRMLEWYHRSMSDILRDE
jgi:hypothetical protein